MRASAELMRAANSAMRSPSLRRSSLSSSPAARFGAFSEPEGAGLVSVDTVLAPLGSRTIAGHGEVLRRVS